MEVVWLRGWLLCRWVVERVTERQKLERSKRQFFIILLYNLHYFNVLYKIKVEILGVL